MDRLGDWALRLSIFSIFVHSWVEVGFEEAVGMLVFAAGGSALLVLLVVNATSHLGRKS